jgi:hypothetical protein
MNPLIVAVDSWAADLTSGCAKVTHPPIAEDDDYGLEAIVAFEPVRPGACPLEVGIIGGQQPGAYVFLDNWGAIAKRTNLGVDPRAGSRVGLFREPETMSAQRLRLICGAVAAGAVQLEVGAWGARLAWTAGSLRLPDGPLAMHGSGTRPPLAGLLARAGVVRVVAVEYEPWNESSTQLAERSR